VAWSVITNLRKVFIASFYNAQNVVLLADLAVLLYWYKEKPFCMRTWLDIKLLIFPIFCLYPIH